jgi:hypothetical protein
MSDGRHRLPSHLGSIGLGAAALGAMEGAADRAFSLSKLAGGAVGHRVKRKRPWATAGYLATTIGTGAIALVQGLAAVVTFRTFAWFGCVGALGVIWMWILSRRGVVR